MFINKSTNLEFFVKYFKNTADNEVKAKVHPIETRILINKLPITSNFTGINPISKIGYLFGK